MLSTVKRIKSDVLIIGGGIAGAFASMRAKERSSNVLLIDKAFFGRGGASALASGAYMTYLPEDSLEQWVKAGSHALINHKLLKKTIPMTYDILLEMERWGVKFIKDGENFLRVQGAGCIDPQGEAMLDGGGPAMMLTIRSEVLKRGVKVISRIMVTDLLTSDGTHPTKGKVTGALGFHTLTGERYVFNAKATIMCTGGYRMPYPKHYGNLSLGGMSWDLSSDGQGAMWRAGAELSRLEIGVGSMDPLEQYCAPGMEVLLGYAGRFIDEEGKPLIETGGRDASRRWMLALRAAKKVMNGEKIFLDLTQITGDEMRVIEKVIPIIMRTFKAAGIDVRKDPIPFTSTVLAGGTTMAGGAKIDEDGRTSISGLFSAGSCTDQAYIFLGGLPTCAITGRWAGEGASGYAEMEDLVDPSEEQIKRLLRRVDEPYAIHDGVQFEDLQERVSKMLIDTLGVVYNEEKISTALSYLDEFEDMGRKLKARTPRELAKVIGLKNYIATLRVVLTVLGYRKESRGAVLRDDYQFMDNVDWLKRIIARWDGTRITVRTESPEVDHIHPVQKVKAIHGFFSTERN